MKWFTTLITSVFLVIIGCTPTMTMTYRYNIGLANVERPANARVQYGDIQLVRVQSGDTVKYHFEDSLLSVFWMPTDDQVYFWLNNKSQHTLKLIWDETAFVYPSGVSARVMHEGVKYNDRNNSQPPTIIPKDGSLFDCLNPTDRVFFGYKSYVLYDGYEWQTAPYLCPSDVGKDFRIVLPLQVEGVTNEYTFQFHVNSVDSLLK